MKGMAKYEDRLESNRRAFQVFNTKRREVLQEVYIERVHPLLNALILELPKRGFGVELRHGSSENQLGLFPSLLGFERSGFRRSGVAALDINRLDPIIDEVLWVSFRAVFRFDRLGSTGLPGQSYTGALSYRVGVPERVYWEPTAGFDPDVAIQRVVDAWVQESLWERRWHKG